MKPGAEAWQPTTDLASAGAFLYPARPLNDWDEIMLENTLERLETLTLALAGKDMSLRPSYWQALSEDNKAAIRQRAKPLRDLRNRSVTHASTVDQWLSKHSRTMDQLVFLPMVGRDQYWSAVMDSSTLEIIGYLPIDGF